MTETSGDQRQVSAIADALADLPATSPPLPPECLPPLDDQRRAGLFHHPSFPSPAARPPYRSPPRATPPEEHQRQPQPKAHVPSFRRAMAARPPHRRALRPKSPNQPLSVTSYSIPFSTLLKDFTQPD